MSPKSKSAAGTSDFRNNVTRLLESQRVDYTIHAYDPSIGSTGSAVDVAHAIGLPPERVVKTLVVLADEPGAKPMLAIIPAANTLDLKAFARAAKLKKVRMATHQQAETLTGLQTGGISALALTHKPFRVFIDEATLSLSSIAVSAGQRGANVELAPAALVRLTGARPAAL